MLPPAPRLALLLGAALWLLAGCPTTTTDDDDDTATDDDDDDDSVECSDEDADGDGLDECAELELGSDPDNPDSDGDGLTDGEEADCVSDPTDGDEVCYACGWPHADPGTLESAGADYGDVIANLPFIDQCLEDVNMWDFFGKYHILFLTAAW
jgi:hypothetical protein